ncbi:hypothetical protein LBMAG42_26940 [Deltaproteobacteria bacterium]|nr:hypothetical protein LBMAG42_26940 [Deltaproteobacteria bacterium]
MQEGTRGGGAGVTAGIVIAAVLLVAIGGPALVMCIGVTAAIAIPNFVAMQAKAKRAEVPGYVDGIKTAELAYDAAFDEFVPAGSEDEARRAVSKTPHEWRRDSAWDRLGWMPDGPLRGGYWVEVHGGDFTVHGICDVDGDGVYAEYTATSSRNATLETGANTY